MCVSIGRRKGRKGLREDQDKGYFALPEGGLAGLSTHADQSIHPGVTPSSTKPHRSGLRTPISGTTACRPPLPPRPANPFCFPCPLLSVVSAILKVFDSTLFVCVCVCVFSLCSVSGGSYPQASEDPDDEPRSGGSHRRRLQRCHPGVPHS